MTGRPGNVFEPDAGKATPHLIQKFVFVGLS